MKLKELTLYTPEKKEAANVLYLKDVNGNDWYESQEKFNPACLKIAYTDDGVIRSADYDVSALWPVNMSVAEVDTKSVPDGFNINGGWRYNGNSIVAVPVNYQANLDQLIAEAESVIKILERTVRLGIATNEEKNSLAAWEKYSVLLSRIKAEDLPEAGLPEKPVAIV
ncbi:tail fiber assembly protein [Klebsiella aerogenes]|uniref:tail fiber assembly protein n=1 Tax=Klebsiella aerogenes TaxID=548 RepID=UPI00044FBB46|nr:tail fiber assembly protein [Klebsiella aerogenes]AMQ58843.1 tail fiber assembly protein [Klebsiella aerogenes]EKY0564494.1 tail fiber assembly protein [Klebsiella aerogenes]ELA1600812.1 tail fiber assembly protein [Klebsiella aerogenes]ELA1744721.1 tail fiber assembly protein [Klebsiella aerogenes]ELB6541981.1 tail fiber assembly protein [Klebsiella aerogenes]